MLEPKCYYCKIFIDTYNIGHIDNTYMYCCLCIHKYIGIQRELFGSKIRLKKKSILRKKPIIDNLCLS